MKRLLPAAATGLLLLAAAGAGVALMADRHLSFRPPFYQPEAPPTPRQRALADLEQERREREEAERRRAELLANLDTASMVELGREIVHGRGLCFNCHQIDGEGRGKQGPNLAGVGERAAGRVPGLSDVEYLTQSLYQPDAFVVPGYAAGMVPVDRAPIGLDDLEVLMVVAYLQSLGGEPTVSPDTVLPGRPPRDRGAAAATP
ncbi:MAG TPA: cytochrome c [Thermoanaerobaculia bacterium]|nr:cytochrome c [Thermoanaerobaculia bacterium]